MGRLAEILADSLAGFFFPDHAVPVVRVLVDIAASYGGGGGKGGGGGGGGVAVGGGGNEYDSGGLAAAAAALAMLSSLVSRAEGTAASALFDASGGGGGGGSVGGVPAPAAVSLFTPIASLLDGPHSAAALELLQRVAAAAAAAETKAGTSASEAGVGVGVWVLDWGRIARLGSPSQMWDSVEANGGRAVDLMYGVMLCARMDPTQAALPACLVGASIDQ